MEIPFDREKWKREDSITQNTSRPGMAKNLVNQKLLIGKNRAEIEEMLGKPETLPKEVKNIFIYTTEEDFGWDIDPVYAEWLEITFDQENEVEKAEIKSQKMR